ncbi:hypothetical protein PNK_2324 [Candidatus Protochlamydia naegleriophila]|uniref:Teneurin-like YD-shell domain-containing protein n=1 Tax=Candidatus Protochlamydia naegleriophila TaxID=389348 RepID=A0A0U5JH39_9BACT|nr:RHS repeat-associated core domain-containing protein [Candidatus Protochlamydia naegleriophila]CUI17922.1 hypothetical protein PNK_2324 [Candidatus Protochlamydia naegleriophila]
MYKKAFRFILFVACLLTHFLAADSPSVTAPTPFVNSINVMTGKGEGIEPVGIQSEYYIQGTNLVGSRKIQLAKGDFRIGRIKSQTVVDSKQEPIYFFYEPGMTEIIDHPQRKSVYRYSPKHLLESVEQYEKQEGHYALYRSERFFWRTDLKAPLMTSRVLEDGKRQAIHCTQFSYDDQGQLIRETLYGNLSGSCPFPLIIESDGTPEFNGIENYATAYRYHPTEPDLLLSIREDNGITTTYQYEPKTKRCLAKLKGYANGLLSRAFYHYDEKGLLCRTVFDDGQGSTEDDLTGLTNRQIIHIQSCHTGAAFSQPLVTESLYLDLDSSQEVLLDRTVYAYSDEGAPLKKDFYDADENLRYSIHFNYNDQGQLVSTVDSRGEEVSAPETAFEDRFNDEGLRIASLDAYGNETTYEYDLFGRLIETKLPAVLDENDNPIQLTLHQSYNICDQVVEVEDTQGGITRTRHNSRSKPVYIQHPDGSSETLTYYLDGELKEKIDRKGVRTTISRDKTGRTTRVEEHAASGELLRALNYTYRGSAVSSLSNGAQFTIDFEYDGAGRQIRSFHKTADGIKRVEWSYDACGERIQTSEWFSPQSDGFVAKIEEKDAWQQTTATRLEDAYGNIQRRVENTQKPEALFTQELSTRNSLGQYVKLCETVNEKGIKELNTYDVLGRLDSSVQLNSLGEKMREHHIRYNKSGQKVLEKHLILANGQEAGSYLIRWSYDSSGRLLALYEAAGSSHQKVTYYQYDESGRLIALIKPDGIALNYTYNSKNLLASFKASDSSFAYAYHYDGQQRLVAVHDLIHDIVQTKRYNAFDEVVEENLGTEHTTLRYNYDLAGRKTEIELPDASRILYHYEGSYLKSVERTDADQNSVYIHHYNYSHPAGAINSCDLIAGVGSLSYRHDAQGQLIAIESPWWSETITESDRANRLTALSIEDPLGSINHSYVYADDNQLLEEQGEVNHSYHYDSLYNRIAQNGQAWKVNPLNQLVETPSHQFLYDSNGNLVGKHGSGRPYEYTYDALNRLTSITCPTQFSVHYLYDAFDRCLSQEIYLWNSQEATWKKDHASFFIYDGHKEIGKLNHAYQLTELRVLGLGKGAEISAAIAIEIGERVFAPIHDHQGSVRCLVDTATGAVAEFYRYSAFGIETIFDSLGERLEGSEVGNPWRFSSKRMEEQTGLVSFGKRYYDPQMGRWLSPDPLFFYDTPNLYAFVRNNSINHYDLYGLFSIGNVWDTAINFFFDSFHHLQTSAHHFKTRLNSELKLPEPLGAAFERIGRRLFGSTTYALMGNDYERTEVGTYGKKEMGDKIRVSFINGILTSHKDMLENLEIISESHGGVKVHYIFRPTEGWTWDISRAMIIKMAFGLGFRSIHAHLLAAQWRSLIHEMGGIEGGGTIIHYAHSLGGTETDRARALLSPEEQRMIRVVTFGSATMVCNQGFENVVNYVSVHDGVCKLDLFGNIRNLFDPSSNIRFQGDFLSWHLCSTLGIKDHFLSGPTYAPIIRQLGEQFLREFSP